MVIWLKFSPRVHFSLLILKMLMLPLAISYLATSNSPWFMDLIVYAILFFAELDFTSMTRHISSCAVEKGCLLWPIVPSTQRKKLNIVFALAQLLHPFWSYQYLPSSLPCSTSDIFWPGGLSSSIISFCLFVPFMGFKQWEYWSGLPLSALVDHILSQLSTVTHCLRWPCTSWLLASLSYANPFTMMRLWSMKG